MAKLAFDSKFKKNTGFFEFPKLKLESGEKARICVLDPAPEAKYVHTLRKIVLEGGRPTMETVRYGKNNDKTKEVPKTDFVGKFLCLGDDAPDGPLDKNEVDPDNCPACKAAVESGGAVDKPQRRIVFHVFRYKTTKGSFSVSKPFQGELLAWDITDNRFGRLLDIREENGDLAGIDLNLGPCENANFQKFDITPTPKAEWRADEERERYTKEVWKSQKSDDLPLLLGRNVSAAELRGEVAQVVNQYNLAFGNNSVNAMPVPAGNSDADFSDLLGGADDESKTGEADFFAQPDADPSFDPPTTDEPSSAVGVEDSETETEEPKKSEDLDDLLADFN